MFEIRKSLLSIGLAIACSLGARPALKAQIPEGWIVTSHFQFCQIPVFPAGGVLAHDPRTGDIEQIDGLPSDLVSNPCEGELQGASSVLVRPIDGALFVGEGTTADKILEIFEISLDGFSSDTVKRFPVGVTTRSAEVTQMGFLRSGSVLFLAVGVASPEVAGSSFLGVLDPREAPEDSIQLIALDSALGSPNALAIDESQLHAYVGFFTGFQTSTIFRVDLRELRSGHTDLEPVGSIPMGVTGLAAHGSSRLYASGFGANAGPHVVNVHNGSSERLCSVQSDIQGDANALAFHPQSNELLVFFGGPVNPPPLGSNVVFLRPTQASCRIDRTLPLPVTKWSVLSGISIRSKPLPAFRRGDVNRDGSTGIGDVIEILHSLFLRVRDFGCPAAADWNADGLLDITDAINGFRFLFSNGDAPAPPFPACDLSMISSDVNLGCDNGPADCR